MRVTQHSGRVTRSGKSYNTKHNDRSFDSQADNIDPDRSHLNVYWNYYGNPDLTFDQAEQIFYEDTFKQTLDQTNAKYTKSGHKDRCKTMDQWRSSKQHCPEEIIIQIGSVEGHADPEIFKQCVSEYLAELEQYNRIKVLDYAIHLDEAVPHAHIRRVWLAQKDGLWTTGQEQALKDMGVDLPDPEKSPGKNNNRKMTFDKRMREKWLDICERNGLTVERDPLPDGKHNRTKEEMIRDKFRDLDLKNQELKAELNSKSEDLSRIKGELIHQEDLKERTVDKTILGRSKDTVTLPYEEYQALHLNATLVKNVLERSQRLQKAEKEVSSIKRALDQNKAEIGLMRADLEQRISQSPDYKLKYYSESRKVDELSKEIADLKAENSGLSNRNADLTAKMNTVDADLRILDLVREWVGKIWDKLVEILDLEDILKNPRSQVSLSRSMYAREFESVNGSGTYPKPYTRIDPDGNIQYYWQGGNSDRHGCLLMKYGPMIREFNHDGGSLDMLDQEIFNEYMSNFRHYPEHTHDMIR